MARDLFETLAAAALIAEADESVRMEWQAPASA
jgi:hypothetical protein